MFKFDPGLSLHNVSLQGNLHRSRGSIRDGHFQQASF